MKSIYIIDDYVKDEDFLDEDIECDKCGSNDVILLEIDQMNWMTDCYFEKTKHEFLYKCNECMLEWSFYYDESGKKTII